MLVSADKDTQPDALAGLAAAGALAVSDIPFPGAYIRGKSCT